MYAPALKVSDAGAMLWGFRDSTSDLGKVLMSVLVRVLEPGLAGFTGVCTARTCTHLRRRPAVLGAKLRADAPLRAAVEGRKLILKANFGTRFTTFLLERAEDKRGPPEVINLHRPTVDPREPRPAVPAADVDADAASPS